MSQGAAVGTADVAPHVGALRRLGRFLLLVHEGGSSRFWELDALRGIPIVMMIVFHLAYDLVMFGFISGEPFEGKWRPASSVIVVQFVFLAGMALALADQRGRRTRSAAELRARHLSRGLKLIGWGLTITAVTWLYFGQPVVVFGILQLIGTATLVSTLVLGWGYYALIPGLAATSVGVYLTTVQGADPRLGWFGVGPPPPAQLDFFPFLPWVGVMILGTVAGRYLYPGGAPRFRLPDWSGKPVLRPLIWMGAHSLPVYLAHQPLLIAVLLLALRM
ncbi:MAG: DUF1624 domain-containing protein [Anaerolineae bacterium]|nr:DUF1624 domain-containing protein [Anaerolineae bacterium]